MPRRRSQRAPIVLSVLALLGLSACHTVLVSDYDPTFDQEITATYQDIDTLLTEIVSQTSASDPTVSAIPYSRVAGNYAHIEAELDAMQVRADAHSLNGPTSASVAKIRDSFDALQKDHQSGAALHVAHVRNELNILTHDFQVLMAAEIAKKRDQ
jgi:hypothetical protein